MLDDDTCYRLIAQWAFPEPVPELDVEWTDHYQFGHIPVSEVEPAPSLPDNPGIVERETATMTTLDALKAALYTALWTFIGTWGITLLGWLQDLTEWATSEGATAFPALSALGYAAVAAIVAAFSGVVAFVVRFAQSRGVFGNRAAANGPSYATADRS